jgi:hypothetical protein
MSIEQEKKIFTIISKRDTSIRNNQKNETLYILCLNTFMGRAVYLRCLILLKKKKPYFQNQFVSSTCNISLARGPYNLY